MANDLRTLSYDKKQDILHKPVNIHQCSCKCSDINPFASTPIIRHSIKLTSKSSYLIGLGCSGYMIIRNMHAESDKQLGLYGDYMKYASIYGIDYERSNPYWED